MTRETIDVALPAGSTSVQVDATTPEGAWAVIAVAHGAGSHMDHPGVTGFTDAMNAAGVATVRFNFAYVESGRRMPGPPAHAIAAWEAVAAHVGTEHAPLPFVAAGRSYGGRMASMAAAEGRIRPRGLVYLGYPLHPPGRPEKPRVEHLPAVVPPQLFLSGTRDAFVQPHRQLEEAVSSCRDASVHWVDGAGHAFDIAGRRRPADESAAELAPVVVDWMRARFRSDQRPEA
ncbi:alpha/beta hydrolase family protein [Microbacterium xanthum]|uniref:alpha/beta hydrolase family protein n=1 Tax=Microbacterium xanthum TaxID=3079794 RepID=UPI002AD1F74F|nr:MULTISPECIES: alpha/beta family hydrolase [unclassified Microbacterium]MDZ8172152.1 alpha/beta family hydrolase [Microbacterium sp. KSW-48]MDZ8202141.1 alpha/beta family hydrolase [Microbacterium sp. SSW1-59]